jgi:DNA-binding XRE family transcriptional regulator
VWLIAGGPKRREEREILQSEFVLLAARAAAGADLVALTSNRDERVQAWLHHVRDRCPQYRQFYGLCRLFEASGHACDELADVARDRQRPIEPASVRTEENRPMWAQNLAFLRKEAGWQHQDVGAKVNLDRTTVIAHESGRARPRDLALYSQLYSVEFDCAILAVDLEGPTEVLVTMIRSALERRRASKLPR